MVSFQRITLSFLLVSGALFAYLIPHSPTRLWKDLPVDGWKTTTTRLVAPSSFIFRWAMYIFTCWVMRKVRFSISSQV